MPDKSEFDHARLYFNFYTLENIGNDIIFFWGEYFKKSRWNFETDASQAQYLAENQFKYFILFRVNFAEVLIFEKNINFNKFVY